MLKKLLSAILYPTSKDIIKKLIKDIDKSMHDPSFGGIPREIELEPELKDNCYEFLSNFNIARNKMPISDTLFCIKAQISRSLYSKIIYKKMEYPSMNSAICIILALEPTWDVFNDLFSKAGYELSGKYRIIISECINSKVFSIITINKLLQKYNLPKIKCKKYSSSDEGERKNFEKNKLLMKQFMLSTLKDRLYIEDETLLNEIMNKSDWYECSSSIRTIIYGMSMLYEKNRNIEFDYDTIEKINEIIESDEEEIQPKYMEFFYNKFLSTPKQKLMTMEILNKVSDFFIT